MGRIIVNGNKRLYGSISVHGSKNATLPIMAASLLSKEITVIGNYPDIADVGAMQEILEYLGCVVYKNKNAIIIDACNAVNRDLPEEITRTLRASSILMGPLLARFGKVRMARPGGCDIGTRPLDIHMNAFKALGASWSTSDEWIEAECTRMHGNDIYLRFPSVGATENAIMAAVGSPGITVIKNCAREPDIMQLCSYLRASGANVQGDGTEQITIAGGIELEPVSYNISADRIVAGTYIAAVAACGGEIVLENCKMSDMQGFMDVYAGIGVKFYCTGNGVHVIMNDKPVHLNYIETAPFPGFPTDMQSMTLSVLATAEGTTVMSEKIFENRYKIVGELKKMGADISVQGREACVHGVEKLTGCSVSAGDLRGCAALVIAGLSAKGKTVIYNADYILRGYVDLCGNLRKLGAQIEWEE